MPENYTMFGDINKMTKADFQTAIKYYESRKSKVASDKKIDEKSREWFDKFYTRRINGLNYFYQELSGVIAQEKADDKYVNESAATLESLGKSKDTWDFDHLTSKKNPFRKLYGDKSYYASQVLKIVGAVCLPIVGTIPLVKSFIRSKNKRKVLKREQVELQNFVAKNARSYDQKLYGAEKLTDAEMEQILGRTKTLGEEEDGTPKGEIKRLEEIANNPANYGLSPVQVKNLKKHITELREFAQKNGYTDPEFLSEYGNNLPDETKYETDLDKNNKKINDLNTNVRADTAALETDPTDFKDAYEKFIKIQDYIKQVEELEKKLPKDMDRSTLETLKNDLNSRLEELKQKATEKIENSETPIKNAIDTAAALVTDRTKKAELENSNTALDTAVTTGIATTKLGTTLAEAIEMARTLGIPTDKLTALQQLYNDSKGKNNADLGALKTADDTKTEIEDATTRLNGINTALETGSTEIKKDNLKDPLNKKDIDRLISEAESLIASVEGKKSDASTMSDLRDAHSKFIKKQKDYDDALKEIAEEEEAAKEKETDKNEEDDLERILNNIKERINFCNPVNEDTAERLKTHIDKIIEDLSDTNLHNRIIEYARKYNTPPTLSNKLSDLITMAENKKKDIQKELDKVAEKKKDEETETEEKRAAKESVKEIEKSMEKLRDLTTTYRSFDVDGIPNGHTEQAKQKRALRVESIKSNNIAKLTDVISQCEDLKIKVNSLDSRYITPDEKNILIDRINIIKSGAEGAITTISSQLDAIKAL